MSADPPVLYGAQGTPPWRGAGAFFEVWVSTVPLPSSPGIRLEVGRTGRAAPG